MINCESCGSDIEEQFEVSVDDSVADNWDGYYDNDSEESSVNVPCPCGHYTEISYNKETREVV